MDRKIQPWMHGVLCASWFLMCAQVSEPDYRSQYQAAYCQQLSLCTGQQCAPADYVGRSACAFDEVAAENCHDDLETASCVGAYFFEFPDSCEQVYSDCSPCENDVLLGDMDVVSEIMFGDAATLCANLDLNVFDGTTTGGNPDWGPWVGGDDHTEFHGI